MIVKVIILAHLLSIGTILTAQTEKSKRQIIATDSIMDKSSCPFKISGYIQAQYQYGEPYANLQIGAKNTNANNNYSRLGIRRGRVKLTYEKLIAKAVFQLDITEKRVGVKDAYLKITEPWLKVLSLHAGIFDRPFGYEIGYSSSRRESPERARIFPILFPNERDLGLMIGANFPNESSKNSFKIQAGFFAGNGIKQETDNRRDFISQISFSHHFNTDVSLALGASYYKGSVYQGTANVYKISNNAFIVNNNILNKGAFAKRQYAGLDMQFYVSSSIGKTKLTAEYLSGKQPASGYNSQSPNSNTQPDWDTYIRKFNGGYTMIVHEFIKLPLALIVKYDWYDPNTDLKQDEIGLNGTDIADLQYNTLGLGLLWNINNNIRATAYFDMVKNETTKYISDYNQDQKDNVFTLRLQYKF